MANTINIAAVNQFKTNVFHLAQQEGSLLRSLVRNETQNAEKAYYDYLGSVEASERTGRHSKVEYTDTPHGRRMVSLRNFYHADMVDTTDKLVMIQNPESEYSKAFSNAMGRKIDDVIIDSLLGTAYTGKTGQTPVEMPDTQKYGCTDGTNFSNLNLDSLKFIRKHYKENECGDEPIVLIFNASAEFALLDEEKMTNQDFATVKALVNGEINSFMGIKFINTERLDPLASDITGTKTTGVIGTGSDTLAAATSKRLIAFQKSGFILAVGADVTAKVSELPDYHYSNQVYFSMTMGGARLEEKRIMEIIATQA